MAGAEQHRTENEPNEAEKDLCLHLQLKYEKVKDIFAQLSESQNICKATRQAVEAFEAIEIKTTDHSHILFDEIMDEKPIDEEKRRSLWESLKKLDIAEFRNFFRQHRATKTVTIVNSAGRIPSIICYMKLTSISSDNSAK
jgi:hypothetical protein